MMAAVAVPTSGLRARALRTAIAIAVTASIGLLFLAASCSGEDPVDRVTIVNRTPFDVEVKLSDAEKASWFVLGQAGRESSTVNELVTDMGATWVFRFHYGGRDLGEVTIDRDDLKRARWRVEVPSAVADRMREFGFEPPPDR